MKLKISFKFIFVWLSILLAGALGLAACAGRAIPVAGPNDLARGVKRYPDLTRDQLAQGRLLFADRCGSCHRPPRPTSRPPQAWPGHIREMKERARISGDEIGLIERYLVTMSLAPREQARR